LVNDGEFKLYKNYTKLVTNKRKLPREIKYSIPIANLYTGEFFGEEVLEKESGVYQYTVICSSS
jgi:hypothetical protein